MADQTNGTLNRPNGRGGFRPLQDGYSPGDRRGYTANVNSSGALPKAPVGGTGQTPAAVQQNGSSHKG